MILELSIEEVRAVYAVIEASRAYGVRQSHPPVYNVIDALERAARADYFTW